MISPQYLTHPQSHLYTRFESDWCQQSAGNQRCLRMCIHSRLDSEQQVGRAHDSASQENYQCRTARHIAASAATPVLFWLLPDPGLSYPHRGHLSTSLRSAPRSVTSSGLYQTFENPTPQRRKLAASCCPGRTAAPTMDILDNAPKIRSSISLLHQIPTRHARSIPSFRSRQYQPQICTEC